MVREGQSFQPRPSYSSREAPVASPDSVLAVTLPGKASLLLQKSSKVTTSTAVQPTAVLLRHRRAARAGRRNAKQSVPNNISRHIPHCVMYQGMPRAAIPLAWYEGTF